MKNTVTLDKKYDENSLTKRLFLMSPLHFTEKCKNYKMSLWHVVKNCAKIEPKNIRPHFVFMERRYSPIERQSMQIGFGISHSV